MPETHYIEIDEEIIGAVGRLRKSSAAENIFVFPKRALILQSIINLKLLGREAEKLGKSIIVMSQDDQGMRLAEKAGLRIEEYHDAVLREHRQESDARFTVQLGENIPMPERAGGKGLRRSAEIGSSNFYTQSDAIVSTGEQKPPLSPSPSNPERRTLRVRNRSTETQTALNSRREETSPLSQLPPLSPPSAGGPMVSSDIRKEKLRRLFQSPEESGLSSIRPVPSKSLENSTSTKRPEKKSIGRSIIWTVGSLCVAGGIVLGGYFFLRPEAVVSVEPQEATKVVKRSLVGIVNASEGSREEVPIRFIEEEKTIRLTRPATGKDLANAAKATGLITISNGQGESAQSLVATTRFETADGKLYRLMEGVTVPGMKEEGGKKVPGKIDARVMADATGTGFNITSGTFRIPGFKGSPKYDTITAEVKSAFTGGGDGSGGESLSVSGGDLDLAKEAAAEEAKKIVFAGLASKLTDGEGVLEKSFQTALIGTPSAPSVGTVVPTSFDYEARFQVRGFVISETRLRSILDTEILESAGVTLKPHAYEIGYGTVLSNFETKRVDFTVESQMLFQAPLDGESLKKELLGRNEEGIRTFLGEHPEIKRLQVEFKPKVFIATIPEDPERVIIQFRSDEGKAE